MEPSDQAFYDKLSDPARDFRDNATVKLFADNAAYLAAIRAAQERPQCDFRVDWTKGFNALLPHVTEMRQMARFLCASARHEAQLGRPAEALERLAMVLRISRDVGDDCIVLRMVRCACEGLFAQTLQAVLAESDPEPAAVEQLMGELEKHCRQRPRMAALLRMERAGVSFTVADFLSGKLSLDSLSQGMGNDNGSFGSWLWRVSGRAARGVELYGQYVDDCANAAERPYPGGLDALKEIDARTDRARAASPKDYALVDLLRPAISRVAESAASSEAKLKAALLALGCKLHRQRAGQWPEALADLQAAMPERFGELSSDPFSGRSLLYKRTAEGCLIYSIGRNRKDDGGVPWDSKASVGDLPFELSR